MQVLDVEGIAGCFPIALVASRYNEIITHKLVDGALIRLKELGFQDNQITIVWVPGAIEIPITAQRLARSGRYAAIVCLGAVIYGETRHFDYVCEQVSQGCQEVALKFNVPVIFGILTTNNIEQAHERTGGKKGHMGIQAVDAAFELVSVLRQIK